MGQRLKRYTALTGLFIATIGTPLQAEQSRQVGLVAAVNSSFYQGADNERYLLPLLIVDYDRFYLQGINGGYRLYRDESGQSLALELRRTFDGYSSDDSDTLDGMEDRDGAWEAGLAYEVSVAGGQAKAKLMQDISATHDGFSARLEYERNLWTDDAHMLTWYAGTEYWDSKKTDYYFGVTREEATSTRAFYAADESVSVYLGSNAVKRISTNISLIASAEYLWMTDTVNDSPLTAKQDQWTAYAGIFYQF
ncbi:MAG: MipA/OmpV family protein [Candidatus Thiodiazotropha sp.]